MKINPDEWTTAADLARSWGVTRQWVHKLIRTNRINSRLVFGRRLVLKSTGQPAARKSGPKASAAEDISAQSVSKRKPRRKSPGCCDPQTEAG